MIVVVGMAFEARIAAGPGIRVVCSGDGRSLASAIERSIAQGRCGLISFGVAGGLDSRLTTGSCVVASQIIAAEERIPTDEIWSRVILRVLSAAHHGPLLGVSAPVDQPVRKRKLHADTGALAVDMESHVVARIAAAHSLPMVAVRVITDTAARCVPRSAIEALRADGSTDIAALIRGLIRRPNELPSVVRTAFDAKKARARLLRVRPLLDLASYSPASSNLGVESKAAC